MSGKKNSGFSRAAKIKKCFSLLKFMYNLSKSFDLFTGWVEVIRSILWENLAFFSVIQQEENMNCGGKDNSKVKTFLKGKQIWAIFEQIKEILMKSFEDIFFSTVKGKVSRIYSWQTFSSSPSSIFLFATGEKRKVRQEECKFVVRNLEKYLTSRIISGGMKKYLWEQKICLFTSSSILWLSFHNCLFLFFPPCFHSVINSTFIQ